MFEELLADIEKERQRIADRPAVDAKKEFAANVYPMLSMIVETIGARLAETEDVVSAYIQGEENLIQPELGDQLLGVFDATRHMCAAILAEDTYAPLHDGAKQLVLAVNQIAEIVDAAILEEDDEDDVDDEDDEDDEDEDDETGEVQ